MTGTATYSVGIYARLSHDSHNEKNRSIETQIEMAKKYVSEHSDLYLYNCYTDLGKTGTNFKRDGFEALMQDVRLQRVNCIVVKDLSRFARNYVEMGNYLEKIFPFLGVRFISINEHLDTFAPDYGQDTLGVNLKNLINELYSKDIGVKVKKSKQTKWELGSFTGGNAAYGYRTAWDGKIKYLMPEEETAEIVREIYQMFLSGQNFKQIAAWLYENKIHRPSDYRKFDSVYQRDAEVLHEWGGATIRGILTNPVYIGHLVQGATGGIDNRKKRLHDVSDEDYGVKENTHEAIVSNEVFFQAVERVGNQARYGNKDGFAKIVPLDPDIFKGLLFCGECGKPLSRVSNIKEFSSGDKIRLYAYRCLESRRIDQFACEKKYVTFHSLMEVIRQSLKKEIALSGLKAKRLTVKRLELLEKQREEFTRQREKLNRQIASGKILVSEEYIRYRNGHISQQDFLEMKNKNEETMRKNSIRLAELDHQQREQEQLTDEHVKFLRNLMKFNGKTVPDGKLLRSLIKRIDVYGDNRLEICFLYSKRELISPQEVK